MSKLLETFLALRLQDGEPDLEARRLELNSLVRHLTVSEIRRLRIEINASALSFDICTEFPHELVLCIAEQLDLEDVIRARFVCRSWNRTFSSADFCIEVIKLHFRGVWEKRYRCLSGEQQLVEKEALRQWLSGAAIDRIRRQYGRYYSMSTYRQANKTIEDWQYNNGKIALRRDSSTFIVRDLRTNVIAQFMDENRVDFSTWLLSDEFLIAVKAGPITLRAWSLNSLQTRSIRLPGPIKRISAHHSQVGIVTATNEILIWAVGGPLRSVDNSGVYDQFTDFGLIQGLVVFHPLEEICFFVVYEAKSRGESGNHTCRLVVQEFTEGKLTTTKSLDLHSSQIESLPIIGLVDDGIIGISIVFEEQALAAVEINDDASQSWLRLGLTERKKSDPKTCMLATFDIYKRKFVLEDYRFPGSRDFHSWEKVLGEAFYWRKQILLPFPEENGTAFDIEHMPLDTLIVAINQHNHVRPREVPRYGPIDNEIYPAETEKPSDIAYYWTGGMNFAKGAAINQTTNFWLSGARTGRSALVQGDDNFVVLLAMNGFVVWSFDHKFQVPVQVSNPNAHVQIVHLLSS